MVAVAFSVKGRGVMIADLTLYKEPRHRSATGTCTTTNPTTRIPNTYHMLQQTSSSFSSPSTRQEMFPFLRHEQQVRRHE